MSEEFYIGYQPKMPPKFAMAIKLFVGGVFAVAAGLAVVSWLAQKPFARSAFEFGTVRDFEGTIQAGPVPFLLVEKPRNDNELPAFTRFPLVGEGKHGAAEIVKPFDGRRVRLKGTLIYRNELQMIEVAGGSVETITGAVGQTETLPRPLGSFTLRGEIVDSKCYLGVMNPGQSKPHRDCAVACLRGGIPPLFVVRDGAGNTTELWLVSASGAAVNREILDFVAEPIEITGEVTRTGDQLFFKINPAEIRRMF